MKDTRFSADYAKSVTRDEFIKQHEHHAKDIDLGDIWDKFNPKPVKVDKEVK